jgi:uncharacterized repeat protein (TIGR01451 family)
VADGRYAVIMYGYGVIPGDQFNLKLSLYGGDSLSVFGANPDNNYVVDTVPGEPVELTVDYTVPGPGLWEGGLWFAMPWEEEPTYWYQGSSIYVPVFVNKEGVIPSIEKEVSQEEVVWGDVLTYTIHIENQGSQGVWMEVTDMLPPGLALQWEPTSWIMDQANHETHHGWWYEVSCYLDYDSWMRTIHYGCELGSAYAEDTITFTARVVAQPYTKLINKADLKWYYDGDEPYSFLYDIAESVVLGKFFFPIIMQ